MHLVLPESAVEHHHVGDVAREVLTVDRPAADPQLLGAGADVADGPRRGGLVPQDAVVQVRTCPRRRRSRRASTRPPALRRRCRSSSKRTTSSQRRTQRSVRVAGELVLALLVEHDPGFGSVARRPDARRHRDFVAHAHLRRRLGDTRTRAGGGIEAKHSRISPASHVAPRCVPSARPLAASPRRRPRRRAAASRQRGRRVGRMYAPRVSITRRRVRTTRQRRGRLRATPTRSWPTAAPICARNGGGRRPSVGVRVHKRSVAKSSRSLR